MQVRKQKAMKLRLKGYSYNEIQKELGVPKSTLSDWFSGLVLSHAAQERLKKRVHQGVLNGLVKRNKAQTHIARQRALKIKKDAASEISNFLHDVNLVSGVALYWGEGYKKLIVRNGQEKTSHIISFTNADPIMVRVFTRFLREKMEIPNEKIRLGLRLYSHMQEEVAKRYWEKIVEVPGVRFESITYLVSRSSQGKRPYNQLPYGTVQVRVNDTAQFYRLMGWIEGLQKQLLG